MADNNEWLQRVVVKLNQVFMDGSNFFEERWIFDWDDKLSNTDNFKNIQKEERALSTLNGAKVISVTHKDNFYRDQQEESLALHGRGMWTDFEGADPALRLYDYIWYLWEFDYDRFVQFCESNGFSLNDNQAVEAMDISKKEVGQESGGQVAKLSMVQKVLKVNLGGTTYTLKRYDSTKRFNYKLMKYLLDNPDEWVSESRFESFRMRSKVKDWPKLMGFTGELKDIFLDVNTKERKIMLNPKKSLTPDETEILKTLVNTLKTK